MLSSGRWCPKDRAWKGKSGHPLALKSSGRTSNVVSLEYGCLVDCDVPDLFRLVHDVTIDRTHGLEYLRL